MKRILLFALALFAITSCKEAEKLEPVDIYGNFTKKGFKLEKPYVGKWECVDESSNNKMLVEIYQKDFTVTDIVGTFMSFNNDMAPGRDFLAYLASVPYPRSSPQEAKNWVIENWGNNKSTTWGNAKYELTNKANSVILSVTFVN